MVNLVMVMSAVVVGLAIFQALAVRRLAVVQRSVRDLESRLERQRNALTLLTDTSEGAFAAAARELERIAAAASARRKQETRPKAPGAPARQKGQPRARREEPAAASRARGPSKRRSAASRPEPVSEGEARLRMYLDESRPVEG